MRKKRCISLLLALMLALSCVSFAEAPEEAYEPGQDFEAVFTVSGNPRGAERLRVAVNFDPSVFDLLTKGYRNDRGGFSYMVQVRDGRIGGLRFRVRDNTASGSYPIDITVLSAMDQKGVLLPKEEVAVDPVTVRVRNRGNEEIPTYFSGDRIAVRLEVAKNEEDAELASMRLVYDENVFLLEPPQDIQEGKNTFYLRDEAGQPIHPGTWQWAFFTVRTDAPEGIYQITADTEWVTKGNIPCDASRFVMAPYTVKVEKSQVVKDMEAARAEAEVLNQKLNETVAALEQEKAGREEEKKAKEQALQEKETLANTLGETESALEQKQAALQEVQTENARLQDDVNVLNASLTDEKEQNEALNRQLADKQAEADQAKAELETQKTENSSLQGQLDALNAALASVREEKEALDKLLGEAQAEAKRVTEELAGAQAETERTKAELEKANAETEEAKAALEKAQTAAESIQAELDEARKALTEQTAAFDKAKKENSSLQEQLDQLAESLSAEKAQGESLNQQLQEKTAEAEWLTGELDETKAAAAEKVTELENTKAALEKALADTEAALEQETKVKEEKQAEAESAQTLLAQVQQELTDQTAAYETAKRENTGLQEQLDQLNASLVSRKTQNENLTKQLQEKTAEAERLTGELAEVQAKADSLQTTLTAAQEESKSVREQLASLQNQNTTLQSQLEALTAEKKEAEYQQAEALYASGAYEDAKVLYQKLNGYRDAVSKAKACDEVIEARTSLEMSVNTIICHPGDTIKVVFALSEDGDQPDGVMGRLEYDTDVFTVISSQYLIGTDGINILNREPVVISFQVNQNAPAGYYTIEARVLEAMDIGRKQYTNVQITPVQVMVERKDTSGNTPAPTPTGKPLPLPSMDSKGKKQINAGDYVTFGSYPQTAAGNDETPIEWLVLEVQGNKALLLSRYGLDTKPYNKETNDVTWETCTLRAWLNEEFLNKAFSTKEQQAILLTNVDNSASHGYRGWNTSGGHNTQDKIYLLSYAEAKQYFVVQHNSESGYSSNTKSRVVPTAYAKKQGAYTDGRFNTAEGAAAGRWWLRSPGYYQRSAAFVNIDGSLAYDTFYVDETVVRPALWVDLDSGIF